MTVSLEWDHALEFTGQAGKHEVSIDGNTYAAPSPMQYLALAVTGCMGIDIAQILQKGRHRLTSLAATFTAERAQENPKRFTAIRLHFTVGTDATPGQVERAIKLSRETYCSAMATLRPDTTIEIGYTIAEPGRRHA
jgi:putative redox protein